MSWPRLSETLSFDRELDTCQACGRWEVVLSVWQEHDDNDQPEQVYLVLCDACSDGIIDPHPRLYRRLARFEPAPGAMACCVGCQHLSELRCTNPAMQFNGGTGVPIKAKIASRGFVCSRGRGGSGCQPVTTYSGEPICGGKEA